MAKKSSSASRSKGPVKKPSKEPVSRAAKAPSGKRKGAPKTRATKVSVRPKSYVPAKLKSGRDAGAKSGLPEKRSDLNQPGEVAIERMAEPSRAIARAADAMIRAAVPGCDCVVKWGNPVYSTGQGTDRKAFAAIMETRKGINLALPGAALSDPHKLLEGTGKTMRHVKLHEAGAPNADAVRDLVLQARSVGLEGM